MIKNSIKYNVLSKMVGQLNFVIVLTQILEKTIIIFRLLFVDTVDLKCPSTSGLFLFQGLCD